MSLAERVRELREAKDWSQTRLAEEVTKLGGKLSQQNVANIETGVVKNPGAIIQIAHALGVFPSWLQTGLGMKDASDPMADFKGPDPLEVAAGLVPAMPEPTIETLGTTLTTRAQHAPGRPDIPVWASAQAGRDGAMVLVNDPIDWISRSDRMRGVRDTFAFQVIGDSMSPAVDHGDQVVVNPSVLPTPGKDHVFLQTTEDGTILALVKRLLKVGGTSWKVGQFNPAKEFDLPKAKWAKAFMIAEKRIG